MPSQRQESSPKIISWVDWTCEVVLWVKDGNIAEQAEVILREVMADVEQAASRFKPDSEILTLRDGEQAVVSPTLLDIARCALQAAEATDGLFDPTIGQVLIDWGYRDRVPEVEVSAPSLTLSSRATYRDVKLDVDTSTMQLPAGVVFDLGATAKAWAADEAARRIWERFDVAVVVGIGGDLAVFCHDGDGETVPVGISEGIEPTSTHILVGTCGLATSTTSRRRWRSATTDVHHIIDPRSASPSVGPWRTVTVMAANCVAANHAATVSIIKGDSAQRWLSELQLPARMVSKQGDVTYVSMWPVEC